MIFSQVCFSVIQQNEPSTRFQINDSAYFLFQDFYFYLNFKWRWLGVIPRVESRVRTKKERVSSHKPENPDQQK